MKRMTIKVSWPEGCEHLSDEVLIQELGVEHLHPSFQGNNVLEMDVPPGYEDIHPEITLDDLRLHPAFEAEVVDDE